MHGNIIWYVNYYRCMVMLYDRSPTIDAWPCHIIWYITYNRCIVILLNSSLTIVAWSYHLIRHLLSMHGHVVWYITYHRYMVISYDTSPTNDHMIHHLSSIHGHALGYITYHRCIAMSCDSSPTIYNGSCHVIHHLLSYVHNLCIGERRAIGWNVSSVCRHRDWAGISQRAYRNLTHRQLIPAFSLQRADQEWLAKDAAHVVDRRAIWVFQISSIRERIQQGGGPARLWKYWVLRWIHSKEYRSCDISTEPCLKRPYWRRETSCVSAISSLS